MTSATSITLLGTGTSQGIPVIGCGCPVCNSSDLKDRRLRTSALVQHQDTIIGIDAGPDFRQQMLRARVQHLDALLLTHEHNDHVIGLDDVRPFNFKMRRDLPIYGLPRVLCDVRARFAYAFAENPYPGSPRMDLKPVEAGDQWQIGSISITAYPVTHGELGILGFRFGQIAYITDASYLMPEIIDDLIGIEVLVLNALHLQPHHSHFNLEEALAIIDMIKPQRAFLTHLSHHMGLHAEVLTKLPSNVFVGHDGLMITV